MYNRFMYMYTSHSLICTHTHTHTHTCTHARTHTRTHTHAHTQSEGLPPGWEAAMMPTGRIYYLNHNTQTTTWEKPRVPMRRPLRQESGANPGPVEQVREMTACSTLSVTSPHPHSFHPTHLTLGPRPSRRVGNEEGQGWTNVLC